MNSIWMKDYINQNLPSISKDTTTPILIIGGGIAGLICAYHFMKKGINFILVDGKKLVSGVSAKTTAQISIAHGPLYHEIEKKHNKSTAQTYLKAQIEGLNIMKEIIKTEKINCDFKEEKTILCANLPKNIQILEKQYKIISSINKNCRLNKIQNNFLNGKQGLIFNKQFIINPMKYMMGIINVLIKNKISLYENSKVTEIKKVDEQYVVKINNKHRIITSKIIMAAHYPFLNPDNLYFAKIYQSKSYAIAFKTKIKLDANYVSLDPPYFYLRTYDDSTLIIGGSDHFTGIDNDIKKCYDVLINKIYEIDKDAKIEYRWSTEDCISLDSLPFVGKYSHKNPHIILITGFQKWGFTNSHAAAKDVTKMILQKNYKGIFHPERSVFIKDLKGSLRMIGHVIDGLIISKLFPKKFMLKNIPINSGKNIRYKNMNVLVYRESKNKYIFLKNKCTHMGCALIWNDIEKVWESKCHGSIFDKYGAVLYGPAINNLEKIDL